MQGFVDVDKTGDESIHVESSSTTGPLAFRAADRITIKSAKSERASCFRTYCILSTKIDRSLGGGGVVVFAVVVGGRNRW